MPFKDGTFPLCFFFSGARLKVTSLGCGLPLKLTSADTDGETWTVGERREEGYLDAVFLGSGSCCRRRV